MKLSAANCPKCSGTSEIVSFGDSIHLRRCSDCAGLMLKKAELEALRKAWMADDILDTGDQQVGRLHDQLVDIHCPDCNSKMEILLDEQQQHVCMEYCQDCELIYLDAGELTDLKHLTFMDHVWDFFARRR